MRYRNNVHRFAALILLLSISLMACKKKKTDSVFPTDPGDGGGGGGLTTTVNLPFADDFNAAGTAEYGIPTKWYEAIVSTSKSDRGWGWRSSFGTSSSGCMAASTYGGSNGSDNVYLVTGPFNFSAYSTINIGFDVKKPFSGPGVLTVVYSTNYSGSGDPETSGVTWTEIASVNSQIPTTAGTSEPFTNVVADLSSIRDSKVYLAFHWKDGTAASSASFNVDNFILSNSTLTQCGTDPSTNTTNGYASIVAKTLPFNDSFEYGCDVTEFYIPSTNWAEAVVSGYRTNRGWAYRPTYGKNNNGGMMASAFVSSTATLAGDNTDKDNTYLIVGPFNITSTATRNLALDFKKSNANPGNLKIVYSTNYSGSGNPEGGAVTWTQISDLTSLGNTSSFTTHTVNIGSGSGGPNVTGSAVYFALQFKDGVINSSQSYEINNFSIGN
jgi:hypothetical protein